MIEYIFNIVLMFFSAWIISHETSRQLMDSVAVIKTYCDNKYPFKEARQHHLR